MEQHTNGWTYGLQKFVICYPFFWSTVRQSCKKDLDITWNRLGIDKHCENFSPRMMKKTIVQMFNAYL